MRKAKDIGIRHAIFELFDVLWKINTPDTDAEMVELIRPLAESGHQESMGRLGMVYKNGKGIERNMVTAQDYLFQASEYNPGKWNPVFRNVKL